MAVDILKGSPICSTVHCMSEFSCTLTLLKKHQQHPTFIAFPLLLQERYVISQIPLWVEAAGEPPLTHHKTQRQHKESTNSRHDIGNGHQHGFICLWDIVATVLQVATMKWAFHRGCAKLIVHYSRENRVI